MGSIRAVIAYETIMPKTQKQELKEKHNINTTSFIFRIGELTSWVDIVSSIKGKLLSLYSTTTENHSRSFLALA